MTGISDVAVIVLAAGQSTRFGDENKLLSLIDGEPMIVHCTNIPLRAGVGEVIVVTGHEALSIEKALKDLPVKTVRNVTPEAGMGTSLAAGANAIRSLPETVMIMLGDMPLLKVETLQKLISDFAPETGHDIVVPVQDGRRGHPVLFSATYLPKLCALSGDAGARSILRDHPERVRAVKVDDPGTRYDIDTENDLNGISTTS